MKNSTLGHVLKKKLGDTDLFKWSAFFHAMSIGKLKICVNEDLGHIL